jgi:hypothetical protein
MSDDHDDSRGDSSGGRDDPHAPLVEKIDTKKGKEPLIEITPTPATAPAAPATTTTTITQPTGVRAPFELCYRPIVDRKGKQLKRGGDSDDEDGGGDTTISSMMGGRAGVVAEEIRRMADGVLFHWEDFDVALPPSAVIGAGLK